MSQLNGLNDGNGGGSGNGLNYIEHQVSKLDTLAGVAIKYGVEVADIKRLNGLVTDLQMFALRTLRIPLPGRHPPSSDMCNGHSKSGDNGTKKTPSHLCEFNMSESFESFRKKTPQPKVSQAMNTLQKYYGLGSSNIRTKDEGTEMIVYRNGCSGRCEGEWLPKASSISDLSPISYHKSRNLINGFLHQNGLGPEDVPVREAGDGEAESEKSVRRRLKTDIDGGVVTPERLLKEENSGSSFSSSSTGKGLAMRPKSASRSLLHAESDSVWLDSIPVGLGDTIMTEPNSVRKSSSASSLREQEKLNAATGWTPTMWSLKTDLQALSTSAITKPIFDGLPLPISGRKNKAALD